MRALGLVLLAIGCLIIAAGCGGSSEDEKRPVDSPAGDTPIPVGQQAAPPAAPQKLEVPQAAVAEPAPEPAAEEPAKPATDTAAEEPQPGEIELVETEGIGLLELAVARGVEKRKPIDVGQEFSLADGTKLYAYMLVANPDREEGQQVKVFWQREDGKERGGVAVKVGAQPKWRTWAFHSHVNKPGKWQAIVKNEAGQVLGRAPFVVTD
jgi:hypothetical protein